MPTIQITITDIEQTVLTHVIPDPIEWLRNAIKNRARKAADFCIIQYTDKNPAKMTDLDKVSILKTIDLPPHPGNTEEP